MVLEEMNKQEHVCKIYVTNRIVIRSEVEERECFGVPNFERNGEIYPCTRH